MTSTKRYINLVEDVLVQCMGCHRDMKAGCYDGHECTPYLVAGEEREAGIILKEEISIFSLTYIVMPY